MSRPSQYGSYRFLAALFTLQMGRLACETDDDECSITKGISKEILQKGVNLLQHSFHARTMKHARDDETCTDLLNKGHYFAVNVCVGTPKQCFEVVADTGSDSVIVPSCICDDMRGTGCGADDKCFRGTNKSSTFSIDDDAKGLAITFGSGTIEAVIASDVVETGSIRTRMEDGLLLMVNRAGLKIAGEFEGILGLGIPKEDAAMALLQQYPIPFGGGLNPLMRDLLCLVYPELCDGSQGGQSPWDWDDKDDSPWTGKVGRGARPGDNPGVTNYASKLFLKEANVSRFSMCFRDNNNSGAMRFNIPRLENPIANIGTFHWGIDFQGVSVGANGAAAPSKTVFCGPETMKPGMDTPCGIIPDSGTTLIMGPEKQVSALEAELCTQWPRCAALGTTPSSSEFRKLLYNCSDWLTSDPGLLEIPSVFFHVKSPGGDKMTFELTAWAFITEYGVIGEDAGKVCMSSFGPMEYPTEKNGDVWIFGTPLFYEYDVMYDLSTRQMALKQSHCQPCSDELNGLEAMALTEDNTRYRRPRVVHGKPRIHRYDVRIPL